MKHARLFLLMVATLLCSFGLKAQIVNISALDSEMLCFVWQPMHPEGATSWAVADGGNALKSNKGISVEINREDSRQQFRFVSPDGGITRYLFHPAEGKYVNMDGSLGDTPKDPVYFKAGAYASTFVVYFDNSHFINVNGEREVIINNWGPGGHNGSADGGNSCEIILLGEIDYELEGLLPEAAPRAELWYDFEGVGEKGFVKDHYSYYNYFDVAFTAGISQQFKTIKSYSGSDELSWSATCYIEDLNRDGVVDISTAGANSLLSQGGEFEHNKGMLIVPNFDINNDGRLDYLKSKGNNSWSIMIQQVDGSFVEQFMHVMTEEEYESTFDPENWQSTTTQKSAFTGLVATGGWSSSVRFSGVSLASAPPRREANAPQMRAQGMNPTVEAPTRALDLNADGYVDLIDEKNGILYYNVGEGRWVTSYLGGSVVVADLNGDHIQDFIFPGQELWVAVYRGANDFEIQTLYENIQVDREMYCYDFDRDGDVDILVTFSAPLNSTGYAYTMFFENNGTGQFTQLDEQDYGSNNLLFSNCQDLDGDGYYDLLAFRGDLKGRTGQDLVWLKGQPDKTFAQPEFLVVVTDGKDVNSAKISVEDINNDGHMNVWANVEGICSYSFVGAANTAPTAPAKPSLFYNNGVLAVSWGDGSDDRTATSDLTYALRVGTTPGGDDIVRAHANADGSRRNFLDGNMSKFHNYTLDLRSRQPATIYVSVQTIDAQHLGSAWSEEASIEHTGAFADFRVSKTELGCGEKLIATAIAMPEGFTHTWTAEDGTCTSESHEVEIVFNAAGEKTITHTVTAADGTSTSYVETVNVLPNYMDIMNEYILTDRDYNFYANYDMGWYHNFADYNMDGYWDKFFIEGSNQSAVVLKGSEGYAFAQASGIWNAGLLSLGGNEYYFWYDWDHNGAADLLWTTDYDSDGEVYWLPHNGTSNMKAKQSDSNLEYFVKRQKDSRGDYQHHYIDYTHDGNYDAFWKKSQNGSYQVLMYTRQADGSYQQQDIKGNVSGSDWYNFLSYLEDDEISESRTVDINRDGFVDICGFINTYTSSAVEGMKVMVNKGNCEFEKLSIPFDMTLSANDFPIDAYIFADMNNDGYCDIINQRKSDYAIYVMWNEENQRFSAPEVLPLGELDGFGYVMGGYRDFSSREVVDLDNNGYLDLVTYQQDKSLGDAGYGLYVHYFGPEGIIQQGFVAQGGYFDYSGGDYCRLFKLPNHPWTLAGYDNLGFDNVGDDSGYRYCLFPIHGGENERPSAPTNVRAVQTAKGLLIEWNDAKDDATPGVQMRYNLSVKKKGASGEGAYFISPQNACNSNAAPIRNFNYITATQYLIPTTVLPMGEYEIQLQAIDLQGDWSVFTEPLAVAVEELYLFDAPTLVCVGDYATLTYMGTPSDATPVWDFDDATVRSGSEYGPYVLSWSTPGTKTVTLTVDGKVTKHMIYVDDNEVELELPYTLINNTTVTLDLPEGVDIKWTMMPREGGKEYKPVSEYPDVLKIEGNKLILNNTSAIKDWYISARAYNGNGCERVFSFGRKIYEQTDLPQITVVTADAEGHNVIRWNTGSFSGKVRILKETNRRDQYVEIGEVNVSDGTYTDRSSNATMQGERYAIQLMPDEDVEGTIPMSTPHTTSHLTINRGLIATMWNLIWSDYEGANVVGYNILRGTSADNLEEIGSASSSHNSYTDYAPDANAPYYAIEYILDDGTSYAPSMNRAAARATELKGQTNVVNSNMANTLIYAEKVSVLSATNKYATTEDNLSLALYPEIMPIATTLRSVRWEIVEGEDLATISSTGILTAKNPNRGGTVTVQATTIDGTNITATRTITIAPIGEVDPVSYTVTFYDWDGTVLKTEIVQQGESATAPTAPTRESYTFSGWDKVFTNVQGDLFVYAMYTQNSVEPEPDSGLKYTVEYHHGTYGWLEGSVWYDQSQYVAGYTSPLYRSQQGKVEKLRFTVKSTSEMKKYFCLSELEIYDAEGRKIALTAENVTSNADHNALNPSEPDGGGFAALFDGQMSTYFHSAWKNMPAGDHYLEVTLPNGGYEAFSFKMLSRAYSINPSTNAIVTQTHTFPGEMVLSTAVPLTEEIVQPKPEYTVTFYDWNNAVLKTQTVQQGQDATAPADPIREGYTFTGWDKAFTNIQSDLNVYAVYTQNTPQEYTITFNAGANGWIDGAVWHNQTEKIAIYTSPLYRAQGGKVTKLRITVNRTKGNTKYFCLSELELYDANGTKIALTASNITSNADHNALNAIPDGGGLAALFDGQTSTYFHSAWQNMPAEDHYLEVTLPNGGYDAFSFKMLSRARTIENGYVYDQSHTFPAVMVMSTAVALTAEDNTEPEPQPELDNETLYHVTQPHHEHGATAWVVAKGGSRLQSIIELGIASDKQDARQQFMFISNDGGKTRYLYHPAEKKYVNKDGSLSATPKDAVYFKSGAYANTFVAYFDNAHFVNVDQYRALLINDWGPGGRIGVADGGNSCQITAVGKYDITDIDFLSGEGTGRVQKVLENGEMFIILPDGSKYTMTGVRVK